MSGRARRIASVFALYHAIVFSRPSSSSTVGSQPSSSRAFFDVRDAQLDVGVVRAAGRRSRPAAPLRRLMRWARSKIVTAPRGLPMLNAWPTASGCSRQASTPLTMSVTYDQARICEPSPCDRQVAAGERRLDERADRAAADLARAEDVERVHRDGRQLQLVVVGVRHVLAGELRDGVRPARLADGADRRDLALARRCRRVCRRPRSSRSRRSARACRASRAPPRARCRCRSRSRASRARGSRSTVSTPAIAAQWTKCVAPAAASRSASPSRTSPWMEREVRVVGERRCRRARRGGGCRRR